LNQRLEGMTHALAAVARNTSNATEGSRKELINLAGYKPMELNLIQICFKYN
jgi:hypothetical protein